MSLPLISAENHFAVAGVLFAVVAFALWLERFAWAKKISAAFLVIGIPAVLSNARLIPQQAPAYDFISTYFVLAAIPLLLFKADLRRIFRETGRLMFGFLLAVLGTVAGAACAVLLIPIGEDAAAAGASIAGGYIGGSLNFIAVSQSVGLDDPSRLATVLGAEASAGLLYFAFLTLVPRFAWFRRRLEKWDETHGRLPKAEGSEEAVADGAPTLFDLSAALGGSLLLCALGLWTAEAVGLPSYGILFVTLLAVLAANVIPRQLAKLRGDQETALLLMYVFFAVFGAGADVLTMLREAPVLLAFAFTVVTVHFVVAFGLGRLLRLDPRDTLIGSNACLLGPPTAATQAMAEGWSELVTPGVLAGLFGYVIGNFLGVGLFLALAA
ncbi:MAG: DUF819 family protein [Acidobacteriota bacterium]